MIVCHCNRITDRDLRTNGKGKAGSGCGGCLPAVQKVLMNTPEESTEEEDYQTPQKHETRTGALAPWGGGGPGVDWNKINKKDEEDESHH